MSETIYETQAERDARIDRENREIPWRKKRSRNKARTKGVRNEIYRRAGLACEICRFGFHTILNIHHIKPVQFGGSSHRWNLVLLCPNCHGLAHHYQHHRQPERYEAWTRGLMSCGLSEAQARRLLLIASSEARINDDGSIESAPDPFFTTRYVLVEESGNVGD
jgi:5-methylcytosine-specific restriction endonuclease McrA